MAPARMAAAGFWHQALLHVGVGVACLAVLGAWMYKAERAVLQQVAAMRRGEAATAHTHKRE
jgi:hypothetical protein